MAKATHPAKPTAIGSGARSGQAGQADAPQNIREPSISTRTTYRTRTIKRRRRTRAAVDQLDRQILEVLTDDHPQSVRHVFYRMTDPRLAEPVDKSELGYRHVQNRIKLLRRSQRLPYDWITDSTRSGYFTFTYAGTADFLKSVQGLYRADIWRDAEHYVEVWTESRSIAGVVLDDCRELAVNLYPSGGFSSISLAYAAAEHINEVHGGRAVTVLYIGDYDPAGVLIDRAIERELREHLERDVVFSFDRIGITAEQIETWNLPVKPRKASDRRSPEVKGTVEAEAMPAHVLRHILRDRIEELLPPSALEVARQAEMSERAVINGLINIAELRETRR